MNSKILRSLFYFFSAFMIVTCQAQNKSDTLFPTRTHQVMDDIHTRFQIESLIKATNSRYYGFEIKGNAKIGGECQRLWDSLKLETWVKADFDNNGYTDMLVMGTWNYQPSILCILDSGKDQTTVVELTKGYFVDCFFPKVVTSGTETFIDLYYFRQPGLSMRVDSIGKPKSKRLIFKFGDFVEYNKHPENHRIEKIEYETTFCFGSCPVFRMTINSGRYAVYEPVAYNHAKKGINQGRVDKEIYNEMEALLNYIDFPTLKDRYSVLWTDAQTCVLKITYDNGKVKTIRDYGLLGTYGLNRLYKILFSLRADENWN